MNNILLNRYQFQKQVFERDNFKCVVCGKPFENGGYYIDNGVSLCSEHHIMAETTFLSCEQLRDSTKTI